jgi:hypothetical protein
LEGIGGAGDEAVVEMTSIEEELLVGGTFSGSFPLGSTVLNSIGQRDVWILRQDEEGEILQAHQIGSEEDDVLASMETDGFGNLYAFGEFWFEAFFDTTLVELDKGSKGIYLSRFSTDGKLDWVNVISGKALKVAGDMAMGPAEDLYASGYFSDTLSIGDTLLVAKGDPGLFLSKWTVDGELIWAGSYGGSGAFRARAIAVNPNDEPYVAGNFQGFAILGGDTLSTATADNDVFLLSFSPQGEVQWARKAGGILEDACADIALDDDGNIWLTGDFVGSLNPGDDTYKLTSDGFPNDAYLLRYSPEGAASFSKRIGSNDFDFGLSIDIQEEKLLLGGFFEGMIQLEGKTITSLNGKQNGFVAAFGLDGLLLSITALPSPELSFSSVIHVGEDGREWVGGSFSEALQLTGLPGLLSNGGRDGFLAELSPLFTPLSFPEKTLAPEAYPNPFSNIIYLHRAEEVEKVLLFDNNGRLCKEANKEGRISTAELSPGLYWLSIHFFNGERRRTKMVKVRD